MKKKNTWLWGFLAGLVSTYALSLHVYADDGLRAILESQCSECHGADAPEAGLTIDGVTPISDIPGSYLDRIYKAVIDKKMPPADGGKLSQTERRQLLQGMEAEFKRRRRASRLDSTRRLTVQEFDNSLKALFGVQASFSEGLPQDPVSPVGYDNAADLLTFSSLQMEAYLDVTRLAVERYVDWRETLPGPLYYRIEFEELFYANGDRYKTRALAPSPISLAEVLRQDRRITAGTQYGIPLGPCLPGAYSEDEKLRAAIPKLNQQYVALPERFPVGDLVLKIRAAGTQDRLGRFPRMRVEAGITLGDGCSMDKRVLGEVDVGSPLEEPGTFVFRARLEDIPSKGKQQDGATFDRLSVFDMDQIFISNITPDDQAIFAKGAGGYRDPEEGKEKTAEAIRQLQERQTSLLFLDRIEVEMYPGAGPESATYRWQAPKSVLIGNTDEAEVYNFLTEFMREAYRRPVGEREIELRLELFRELNHRSDSKVALRDTLAAILISPGHLLLGSENTKQNQHDYAARLAFALWLSPPDDALKTTAEKDGFRDPLVRDRQIRRMLEDERFERWIRSFGQQWLGLARYDRTAISRDSYPFWDEYLKEDLREETLKTFSYVVNEDRSVLELLDADYAMLNDRLAMHYGLPGVRTGQLKPVRLPLNSPRGGLLGQGSILGMNSDGVSSHPIRRGAWLLDRLFASPPPPPPPNVPELQKASDSVPLSLKERIEQHRSQAACSACHAGIDPWGIPFEEFDATGRLVSKKADGRAIDSLALLPNGTSIHGVVELKAHLLSEERERFARGFVEHVATHVLGRQPNYADRHYLIEIGERFRESGYRVRSLLHSIVTSPLFWE